MSEEDRDKILNSIKKYFKDHVSLKQPDLDFFLKEVHLDIWSSDEEKAFLWELLSQYGINEEVNYIGVCKGIKELLSSDEERESIKAPSTPIKSQNSTATFEPYNGGHRTSITNTISQIDTEKIKQLRQIFSLLNLQNNGVISIAEIQALLSKYKFIKIPQEELLSFISQISDKATDSSHDNSIIKINFELFSKAISLMEKQVLQQSSDFFAENINDSFDVTQDPAETIDEMNQMEQETGDYLSALSEIKFSLLDTIQLINANYKKIMQQSFDDNENGESVYKTIKEQSFIYESKLKDLDIFVRDMSIQSKKKKTKLDYFKMIVDDLNDNIKGLEDDYRKLYTKYNTNQPIEIDEQINKLLQEIDVANRLSDEKNATIEKLQREIQEKEENYNTLNIKYNQALSNEKESSKEVIRLRVDNTQLNKNYSFIVNEVLMKIQKENDQDSTQKKFGLGVSNRSKDEAAAIDKIQKQMNLTARQKELLALNYERLLQYSIQLDINNQQLLEKNSELEKRIREITEEIEEEKKRLFNEKQTSIILRAENARFQNQLHELSKEIEVNARLRTSTILSRISLNRLSKMETNANALSNLKQVSSANVGGLYNNPFGSQEQMMNLATRGGFMMNQNKSMANFNTNASNQIKTLSTSSSSKAFSHNVNSMGQLEQNANEIEGMQTNANTLFKVGNRANETGGMQTNANAIYKINNSESHTGGLQHNLNTLNKIENTSNAKGGLQTNANALFNIENTSNAKGELQANSNALYQVRNTANNTGGLQTNANALYGNITGIKTQDGLVTASNSNSKIGQQGNYLNQLGTLASSSNTLEGIDSTMGINFDNVRLSKIELENNSNKIQRLEEINPEESASVSEKFKKNVISGSSHVYVSAKNKMFQSTIKEEDENENPTPDKQSLILEDESNAQGTFNPQRQNNKKDFNPSVISNENFDIERESVQINNTEGNIEDYINKGMSNFGLQAQRESKNDSQLFNFNPQFDNNSEMKTSVIERDSSINSELSSKFIRNEKKSHTSVFNQSKMSLTQSQVESNQISHNRCPTVDDISLLLKDEQSTISSYDFLNLRKNTGVIKMIEDFSDYSTSYEMFSDNIQFIEDVDKKSKKILFVTSEFVYLLRPTDLSLKKKFKRDLLKKLYISTKNCNLIAFQFAKGDDLVVETLRRMDLLYYLRDLYKFKSFGKLGFKYSDEFNFKQKGKYITLHANENNHLTTANFANATKMGYLEKMNAGYFSYYFNPKLVVLSNVGLMYFDDPDMPPKKLIPVIGSEIRSCDSKEFKKDNCFEIKFKKERYVFATKTPEQLTEWIGELNKMQKDHSVQIRNINGPQKK